MEDLNIDPMALKKKKPKDPLEERFAPQPLQAPPPAAKSVPPPVATNTGSAATAAQAPIRQQPTTFTNFSRVQAANADVSKREAGLYGRRAEDNAQKAKAQRDALTERFSGGVQSGSVAGLGGMTAETPMTAAQEAAMNTNAEGAYSGPGGLGDVEGIEGVYASTLGAEQNLDALGSDAGVSALIQQQNQFNSSGNNALSGSLIGGAGRKDFDALRARFNPEADLMKAEADAAGLADKARTDSEANAKSWADLRDQAAIAKAAKEKADADAAKSELSEKEAKRKKITDEADFEAKWAAAQGSNTMDEINRAFGSLNSIMSPISQIAENSGNRDPIADWGRKTLNPLVHKDAGTASGSTTGQKIWWQPHQKDVFRQMDAKQWAELNGLSPQAQQAWINQRKRELAEGKPHGKYNSAGIDSLRYL